MTLAPSAPSVDTQMPTAAEAHTSTSLGDGRSKAKKEYYGKTAKKGALWSILRQGGHELIAIPMSMVMARLLSPQDFGIAAASSFFIILATRLTQFGFNASLVRVKDLRPEHLSSVFAVNVGLGILMYGVVFASAPAIGDFLRSPETGQLLQMAALIFLISPFGTVPAALISRRMQFRYATLTEWSDAITSGIITLSLAFNGYGYWSIVAGQLSGTVVRVVLKTYFAGWRPSLRCSREALRELLSFGLGLQAKRILEYATFNLDNLIVGRVLGMTALGFYDKAFTTMNRIVNRLTLGQAYFRIFSIIHEDPERFRRAYSRLVLTISLIGLPAFTAAIVVAESLIVVMYGDKWRPAVLPFQMLCVGGILKLLNAYASQANEAAGHVWPQARRQAAGVVLVVAGAWIGSLYGGLTGAASGVAVAMVLLTAAMQSLVRRTTGLTWGEMLRPQMPAMVGSAALVAVLLAVGMVWRATAGEPHPLPLLLAQMALGGLFYGAFILFSPFAAVRDLVAETVSDLVPANGIKVFAWLRSRAMRSKPQ
jgi:O-antigen/teichoic acid export membrane protein